MDKISRQHILMLFKNGLTLDEIHQCINVPIPLILDLLKREGVSTHEMLDLKARTARQRLGHK